MQWCPLPLDPFKCFDRVQSLALVVNACYLVALFFPPLSLLSFPLLVYTSCHCCLTLFSYLVIARSSSLPHPPRSLTSKASDLPPVNVVPSLYLLSLRLRLPGL